MNPVWIAVISFIVVIGLLAIGLPIAFSLLVVGFAGLLIFSGLEPAFAVIGSAPYSVNISFIFTAVPLFVFMADVMAASGVTRGLFDTVTKWVGWMPGGLGVASVVACAIFATISGGSIMTVAAIGIIAIPEMVRLGYNRKMAMGGVTVGGGLGMLIPPSIPFIIYGGITDESVGRLFFGGFGPGLLLALMYSGLIIIRVMRSPHLAPRAVNVSWRDRLVSTPATLPFLILIFLVLGTIYLGITTPTESAGVGAVGALILSFAMRKLNFKILKEALLSSIKTTSFLLFIVAGGWVLTYFFTAAGVPQTLANMAVSLQVSRWGILIAMMLVLFVLGCFLDAGSMIVLTTPVFYPIILALGFDPIWYGVLLVMNCELAVITPPVGMNLFVMKGILPDSTIGEVIQSTLPYYAITVLGLFIVIIFPQIALWLPNKMIGGA